MTAGAILDLTLVDVARAIRERELSSVDATRASLDALESRGPRYLAVAGLDAERALEVAAACDDELARGESRGPLHGVPMAHKDMFYRRGRVCACGTAIRKSWVPDATATALARLDAAGAVDLGRLNMVEWALGLTGHNAITGTPRNPWNTDHITGGSSSGPVASVSARLTYGSLGSDTGGSIRFPAACTNLVGIKPTYGRVSRANAMPLSPSLDHVGPLTRTVADNALMLQVLAGRDPLDATTSRRAVPDYSAALGRSLKGLRIAVPRKPDIALEAEIERLMDGALAVLTGAGAEAVSVDMPSFAPMNLWRRQVMQAEAAAIHRPMLVGQRDAYNPTTLARLEPGLGIAAVDYLDALRRRGPTADHFVAATLANADMLLLPVMPTAVPRIADTEIDAHPDWVEMINRLGWFMGPINYLGLPALALPMGFTANGLPNAFQLVGRPFDEATLFRAGAAYERETGFSRHAPPAS
ncbi:MAG TPA: amidase [Geminicoccaceae bacterium]|nr:amidase [Geminicoccus sp.]HMU52454.1 amidase [Geminicoccaceae bacterium]